MIKQHIDELNRAYSDNSCLFIGSKLMRVKCPFEVMVLSDIDHFKAGERVVVTAVRMSYSLRIIYKVGPKYYYHSHFALITTI
jgi:hypothetical protein